MPELPEVETIRRTLEGVLRGRRIEDVLIRSPHCLQVDGQPCEAHAFKGFLAGLWVSGLSRKGKYLSLHLDDGSTLLVHLRMTGRLVYRPDGGEPDRHTHVIIKLEGGGEVWFSDVRKFGRLSLYGPGVAPEPLGRLGPDALEGGLDERCFHGLLASSRRAAKAFLLDQGCVSGIGNIYADEALFLAGIHPSRRCVSLSEREAKVLHRAVWEALKGGIEHGGTTFSDYRDGFGRPGNNTARLRVYKREGQPCHRCGNLIEKTTVAGRSTRFCPACQPYD